jgi:ankyrin repeat protein
MLDDDPALLTISYDWGLGGLEDGIGAAGHVGNRAIAEFFLSQGVLLTICVAAMLGQTDDVRAFLESDPEQAQAKGPHGIPVLFHAAMSGKVEIAELLLATGCREGFNQALHGAVNFSHLEMVAWLLEHGVTDTNTLDFQNKTPLEKARAKSDEGIMILLQR